MKWLKKLFINLQNSDKDVQEGDIVLTLGVTPEKEIGEPVYSFVECVKANPRRFSFEQLDNFRMSCRKTYSVADKQTGEEWRLATDYRMSRKLECKELQWLTDDEANYLVSEIYDFFIKRRFRMMEIRNIRFERTQVDERKRLMGVYCK